jgi:hypothetical protein
MPQLASRRRARPRPRRAHGHPARPLVVQCPVPGSHDDSTHPRLKECKAANGYRPLVSDAFTGVTPCARRRRTPTAHRARIESPIGAGRWPFAESLSLASGMAANVPPLLPGFFGGADRDRTGDLLTASQALSQLSYGPKRGAKLARSAGKREPFLMEFKSFGPMAPDLLIRAALRRRLLGRTDPASYKAATRMKATKNRAAPSTDNHSGVGSSSGASVSSVSTGSLTRARYGRWGSSVKTRRQVSADAGAAGSKLGMLFAHRRDQP